MNPYALRLEHRFAAAVEQVWDAWTTESGLRRWWWPGWTPTIEVDLRVGGRYRIAAAAQRIVVRGEYLLVAPMTQLRFSWTWVDGAGGSDEVVGEEELVDVGFVPDADGTLIRLEHTGPWTSAGPTDNYRQGWTSVLGELTAVV
ncbi:SRPBCC family protein [Microlunatus soli]|uniref:Uncharacterized conserved protein YndB, AHSA1/START domain n=1 Tax=Microlunatus soli TaxID=630515 RepID=A0A1H1N0B5_9ACTN|nr:SRPBCC domain-containing protein [Microlunatus soli]SDR92135.1 Uncharacterized conserved protein YndB, AHSA1/START domain [Microlunatus soli]